MNDPRPDLMEAARLFYERGWMLGTAGNLSARAGEGFWITASGRSKGTLELDDFVRAGPGGDIVEAPKGRRPSAEISLHQAIYRHVPQAGAIYHVHSVEANLCGHFAVDGWLGLPPLEMLKGLGVPDENPFVRIPVFPNLVEVPRIAKAMGRWFSDHQPEVPGALIHMHGVTVWGPDTEAARNHLELFEYCFRYLVQARMLAIGG